MLFPLRLLNEIVVVALLLLTPNCTPLVQPPPRSSRGRTRNNTRGHVRRITVAVRTASDGNDSASQQVLLEDRRAWLLRHIRIVAAATTTATLLVPDASSMTALAATQESPSSSLSTVRTNLEECNQTLQKLIDNWERAVIDCMYADVPRELLETKNKEELLEKASTFALFDKSVSVVSCKTKNNLVREYLGLTGIGPLVGLNSELKAALTMLDGDVDALLLVEDIQCTLSRADSLSYESRRDFSSINNFDPAEKESMLSSSTNLVQAKSEIESAVGLLKQFIAVVSSSS